MDKKTERARAAKGLLVSSILVAAVVFFYILGSDKAKEPGFWRNARLTMEILMGDFLQVWEAVYTGKLLVRILAWLVSAIPFVFWIGYAAKMLGGFQWLPQHLKGLFDVDRNETDIPGSEPQQMEKESEESPDPAWSPREIDREKALERLERLRSMYREENIFQDREPCVRVQQLGGDPSKQIDQILDWFGAPDDRYAAVTVNAKNQHEILLAQNEQGEPCIIGLEDKSGDEESGLIQIEYPLRRDEPVELMRQSGQDAVGSYVLTWLGGSKL